MTVRRYVAQRFVSIGEACVETEAVDLASHFIVAMWVVLASRALGREVAGLTQVQRPIVSPAIRSEIAHWLHANFLATLQHQVREGALLRSGLHLREIVHRGALASPVGADVDVFQSALDLSLQTPPASSLARRAADVVDLRRQSHERG